MALPYLIKYVYTNGTDEVIRRGKKIHAIGFVELVEHDELSGSVVFRVKDDAYSTFYKVYVQKYRDPKTMNLRCGCPYNLGDICRHESAALFQLQEMLDKNLLGDQEVVYNQRHTVVKMKHIDLKTIRLLTNPELFNAAEEILRHNLANIVSAKEERVEARLEDEGEVYPLVIQKNEERNFDTSCTCEDHSHALCKHKTALLLQLLNAFGPHYFDTIRNWDKEKNKLLQMYGYTMDDDLKGKFEFTYNEGKPFLRVLDPSIKKINVAPVPVKPVKLVETVAEEPAPEEAEEATGQRLGVVINANASTYPGFSVDVVRGETDESGEKFLDKVEKIDLGKFVNTEAFSEEDKQLVQLLRRFQPSELNKFLNRNSPFSGIWENIVHTEGDTLPEETKSLMLDYLFPKWKKLAQDQAASPFIFYLPLKKAFRTENLIPVRLSAETIVPTFAIGHGEKGWTVRCHVRIDDEQVEVSENGWSNAALFLRDGVFYNWERQDDILLGEYYMENGTKVIPNDQWPALLQQYILPLTRQYRVTFTPGLVKEIKDVVPEIRVQLQEKGEYLVFNPIFSYKGFETKGADKGTLTTAQGDQILVVHRDVDAENAFLQKLEGLHSGFIRPDGTSHLVLRGSEVLRNNWFFLFIDAMKDMKIPVTGFEVLRNFRFNTARPSTHIHISSGVDWFDARVDIQFGEQHIGIAAVKQALASKQSFVQLPDGTLGILPEEWLKKYSLLFKVGENRNEKLRLSKFHFSVIDELYENRDEEELVIRLEEKYERLRAFRSIEEIPAPPTLARILRPYQVSGFQWLNYLREVGWGGILADDMGLGKTVQALSYLSHFHSTNGRLRAVVVCPTTLMYNWENEIRKFTPELTYLVHHGGARAKDSAVFEQYNIIITTYGTLRSDIKWLIGVPFDYAVLDESQAIKNPHSKVAKAACLLSARNRLCLSGTPLQNNTFDIYAQMNFLNPGMLGSVEFFRNEFATPIDKFGEQEQKDHLRRLLYPFLLRRTKEQVAKDLPEKTESILFCEMLDEQRNIYDAYRNDYRAKILGSIDSQGIDKSQLTILQGLMKLRQICDSPAILNEPDKYPNVSAKLEELAREISENISNHKALIFSQFLGMLGLIKEKLKELEIPFEYFDGSTSAPDREKAIQRFQNDDTCRVFLISLKAGGVGLNLTAADYVYIVDPWWNPAVEQQAIDRTHRIGQTKNIFAYRMICKDSIEDKILQLQERKRLLAKDLISDDTGFIKTLSRADVEYLFS
jgi:non-specific serine/threonine protein kinase